MTLSINAVTKVVLKINGEHLHNSDQLKANSEWVLALVPSCDVGKVWNEIMEPIIPDADDRDVRYI